ncbi:MAG: type I-C CRISPR-associated protein Cas8c/Csd1 [Azospirillaceae bacterium]|nr:type I-C CRISPR-associated protein Cas8c/Csd1 [Azospirillaceae bacterium]
MILQSLNAYYDRLLSEGKVQSTGFQEKEIRWVVTLTSEGSFARLMRMGEEKGRGKKFAVPAEVKRTVGIAANLLWDNGEYVFGVPRPGLNEKQRAKVPERRAAFLARIQTLPQDDPGIAAVRTFLETGDWRAIEQAEGWSALIESGANISFRLEGDTGLVCERAAVRLVAMTASQDGVAPPDSWCLVTGRPARAARLHASIKGVRGAQTSGASLVSFNLPAFTSHGWEQGDNAPVGEAAAHGYATALNHLLAREQDRYHHVEGDTTFAFWATGPTPLEDHFLGWLTGHDRDADDDEGAAGTPDGAAVKNTFNTIETIKTGLEALSGDRTPFCILGLAPNAARLAVRFWHQGTVEGIARSIRQHFIDLDVDGLWDKGKAPGLWQLLGAGARGGDAKQLQDQLRGNLSAALVVAILKNTPYPATLFARTIERVKAEQAVWPLRAAIVKASLNRSRRSEEEITVSLDENNTNAGYRLGRLFSVLEGIQQASQGKNKTNVTIRDRYFAAAMSSPRAVFPQLVKLKNAHLKKLMRDKPGLAVHFDKLVNEIFDALPAGGGLPPSLNLDDQGRFILGYHHQRNAWRHHDDDAASESIDE